MRARPELVENFFSEGIYPAISSFVGGVFSIFPFSFAEMLVYAIAAFAVAFPIVCVVKALRKTLTLRRFVSWLLTVGIVGGAGFNAFYWMWGLISIDTRCRRAWGSTRRRIRRESLRRCALH